MKLKTSAWVLPVAPAAPELELKEFSFDYDPEREVLIEPLYGCWEANMDHALERQPIDICAFRQEEAVVLGNGGVCRVLKAPPGGALNPGQICVLLSYAAITHPLAYPKAAHAYDAPGTVGLLALISKADPTQLLPLPEGQPYSLARWAGFALRYVTAWGNWQVARASYRALVSEQEDPAPWVLAWGGGVALAELQLAQAEGFKTAMFASRPERMALLKELGIRPLQRDPVLSAENPEPQAYRAAEKAFLAEIAALTQGRMAGIFIDLIGGSVWKPTLKALGWPGVLTTAGWKQGMNLQYQRALTCMNWQVFVHTHYARPQQARAAFDYALESGWLPPEPEKIWDWQQIPELARAYAQGLDDYFPVFRVPQA